MNQTYDSLIWDVAGRYAVAPELVKAVVTAESNGNPRAYRDEPKIGDASRGLMQVLFSTAQQMGYGGTPEGLFEPETSIEYGTRYLRYQLMRYAGDTASAVGAYNAGSVYRKPDGTFVNQPYVDRVMAWYNRYLGETEAEKDNTVLLRTDLPQMGPLPMSRPSAVPIRFSATATADGDRIASLETFFREDYAPWVLALGGAALLAFLSSRR